MPAIVQVKYLLGISRRLEFVPEAEFTPIHQKAARLTAGLGALIKSLSPDQASASGGAAGDFSNGQNSEARNPEPPEA